MQLTYAWKPANSWILFADDPDDDNDGVLDEDEEDEDTDDDGIPDDEDTDDDNDGVPDDSECEPSLFQNKCQARLSSLTLSTRWLIRVGTETVG